MITLYGYALVRLNGNWVGHISELASDPYALCTRRLPESLKIVSPSDIDSVCDDCIVELTIRRTIRPLKEVLAERARELPS